MMWSGVIVEMLPNDTFQRRPRREFLPSSVRGPADRERSTASRMWR